MTTEEIKDYVDSVIEETSADDDFTLRINAVKEEIETDREWEYLKKTQSYTIPALYTTTQALPTDFESAYRVVSSDGYIQYNPIDFADRDIFKDLPYVYYIDYANSAIGFSNGSGDTVTLYYKKETPDLDLISSNPLMPSNFHKMLAYKYIVDYFMGEDTDDVNNIKARMWQNRFQSLFNKMVDWDAKIKSSSTGERPIPSEDYLTSKGISWR